MNTENTNDVSEQSVNDTVTLSRLLGEFGQVMRVTKLPNGSLEPDTHHSFVVALTAFDIAAKYAPELDQKKILLYALVHDLPELLTGDVATLQATADELQKKAQNDAVAVERIAEIFAAYPHIVAALREYEAGTSEEALFVYWIDKMITIPGHFFDNGENLRALGVRTRQDISEWYDRIRTKLYARPGVPHSSVVKTMELAYQKMRTELLEDEPLEADQDGANYDQCATE